MGLRAKILTLFFVGFGLMTVVAIALLQRNLHQGFLEIEKNEALNLHEQLVRNFEAELDHLNELNTDWANWDGMYHFAHTLDHEFATDEIGPGALKSARLTFVAIFDNQGHQIFANAIDDVSGKPIGVEPFELPMTDVKRLLDSSEAPQLCGLDGSQRGTLLVCWQPIRRTDQSGDRVGTLMMGQMLGGRILTRMRNQSGINFELEELHPKHDPTVPAPRKMVLSDEVQFSPDESNVLTGRLLDIVGQPVLAFRLHFPSDLDRRGEEITWKVIYALLLVTLLNGGALLVGLHFLLIRRLRKLDYQLNRVWRDGSWSERISTPEGNDELAGLGHDINRLLDVIRQQMDTLEAISLTDPLTQIANRRAFDQRLATEMSRHIRNKAPLALLLIDVDYFKRYNDQYGHPEGDQVLKAISTLLRATVSRPTDLPARIGGEEFAIILPDTNLEGARHVADSLQAKLAALDIAHADSPVSEKVTMSIGITLAGEEDPTVLIVRADRATYEAKQAGRNQVCVLLPSEERSAHA